MPANGQQSSRKWKQEEAIGPCLEVEDFHSGPLVVPLPAAHQADSPRPPMANGLKGKWEAENGRQKSSSPARTWKCDRLWCLSPPHMSHVSNLMGRGGGEGGG